MIGSMNKPRSLGILAILLFAVVLAPSVQSYPTGITGAQDGGCSCHGGGVASSDVVPILEGLPLELEAGATYTEHLIHRWAFFFGKHKSCCFGWIPPLG